MVFGVFIFQFFASIDLPEKYNGKRKKKKMMMKKKNSLHCFTLCIFIPDQFPLRKLQK